MLASPSPPHRTDHPHDHGHEDHGHEGHDRSEHKHAHSHAHPHNHEHRTPRKARQRRIRSLMALSGGQRLLLVVPLLAGLWLATFWAVS